MNAEEQRKKDLSAGEGGQPSASNESGLSFQAEPSNLQDSEDRSDSQNPDPGKSSPSAGFTPGPPGRARAPFFSPTAAVLALVIIALIIAAIWLLL